ncbi:MAG: ABC transporter permease [Clostridiales bacterium]|jgi:simple sugar transport system permease protein|nr:ABC transporter permease [Clostridiales bacterium]
MTKVNQFISKVGWSRPILGMFLIVLFIICPLVGIKIDFAITNTIGRFAMYIVLVLSLVPMIQTGCGLNFGIPIGIVCGVFGAVLSVEFRLAGPLGLAVAMLIGAALGVLVGFLYGLILNKVKGDEMIISTYVGMAFIAFMNLFWVKLLPVTNPILVMGYGGQGLRTSVTLEENWAGVLDNFLSFKIGDIIEIPTGLILFGVFCCILMWLFFKTKLGTAMTAVGSNPEYARASGIDINKMRLISVVISTAVAAVGIICYAQSYTFLQMYNASNSFTFVTVAAILIGGAAIKKASITNVLIGAFLFQGIVTIGPMVVSAQLGDIADVVRLIVSNGTILYALTRKERA